ncbi:MAG TPA: tetratricopeptide repeat protein [Terriglobales bacterium]|nr:tetratricopeptide repeat protein [Terriglobales bacterium]
MRFPVTFLFIFAVAVWSPAEVIHLKNGKTIWADHVRENGAHLEYDVGDDSYAILKSSVEKIDAGGVRPDFAAGAATTKEIPDFAPATSLSNEASLAGKVIHEERVDTDALSALEQGDPRQAAVGYFIAGKYEFERGNFSKAGSYFQLAVRLDPENPGILNYYAAMLVRTGNPDQGLVYAQRAVQLAPDSADALAVLGYAQFAADRNKDAIQSWKKSLAIRPDPSIQQYLEKAERDSKAEADFTQRESSHFTIRYEGKHTPEALRQQLAATLESEYDDLVREFGVAPRSSIPVILYTGQAFFDVTQAPAWSGAINDGKLRIPVEGLNSVSPELARVLKHELAHSFINQLSGGRCPQWLHEGIAQAMEPKSLNGHGQRLAQLFHDQHEIPFNALEGNFMRFSPLEAVLAYDESLAAVDYINDTYGMSDLMRVLQRLNEGSSTEAALRSTIHSDYGQLEGEVAKYLASKYGN